MLAFPIIISVAPTVTGGCDPVVLPKRGLQTGPQGAVCRCNESACDFIAPLGQVPKAGYVAYATSLQIATERLSRSEGLLEPTPTTSATHLVTVDPTQHFQTMKGFGAAFTDAATLGYNTLTPAAQANLLRSYWGEGGLRYSIGRIPIGASDFSTSVYSYNDEQFASPGVEDVNLTHFSVEIDEELGKLPLIRSAQELASTAAHTAVGAIAFTSVNSAPGLSFFGSCWAPPPWMTTKNTTLNAELRDQPGGPIHQAYARYLSRFISEYAKKGVDVWAITGGNEPAGNTGKWQDLKFTAAGQRDFIKTDLGPMLAKNNPSCELMILDDQRVHLPDWADTVLGDPEAAKYVQGIGVHWYAATEDTFPFWRSMTSAHDKHPDVYILGTEACEGFLPWSQGPFPGDWERGERYALDVINDANNWASGWTDWNFCLDLSGGPNWAGNICDAPILVGTEHSERAAPGSVSVFYKQPMFYYFGHIAAFVAPGATRLGVSSTASGLLGSALISAAFLTPDGTLVVVVVMNRDGSAHEAAIGVPKGFLNVQLPPHSIRTYVVAL